MRVDHSRVPYRGLQVEVEVREQTAHHNLRLVIGRRLRNSLAPGPLAAGLLEYEGVRLAQPLRRAISRELMERHRAAFASQEAG